MTTATATHLEPLTIETAPEASRPLLEGVQKAYGFIPNLIATMAHAPATLKSYLDLDRNFSSSSFSANEQQLVLLAVSLVNDCRYCIAAHSTILKNMLHVNPSIVAAVRGGYSTGDQRLDALVATAQEIAAERGSLSEATREAFLAAGFQPAQIAELLTGVAMKTISNYLDHVNEIEIEAAFAAEA